MESQTKFKTGDRVRIRSLQSLKKDFGVIGSMRDWKSDLGLIKAMEVECGKEVTISAVYKFPAITYYILEESRYSWDEQTLAPLETVLESIINEMRREIYGKG